MSEYHLNNFGRKILISGIALSPFVVCAFTSVCLRIAILNDALPSKSPQSDTLGVCIGALLALAPFGVGGLFTAVIRGLMRRGI